MDRGFGGYYRGKNNARRDDKRYDDFYDRDRRGGGSFRGNRNGGGNRGGNRDRGFFDNQGNHNAGQNSVIAALQLQNQNLLSAYIRNQSQSRANVFNPQSSRNRHYNQGSSFKSGDKRRQESGGPSNFKKSKPAQTSYGRESERRSTSRSSSSRRESTTSKKEEMKRVEEELPDIPDDQVEIPDNIMDDVEKLRQRKDVERNVADEDIEKLVVFSYNGKGYDCLTCGFMLMKDVAFKSHLLSKSHVMSVIDARSEKKYQATRDILDIDLSPDGWFEKNEIARKIILKQAKLLMKINMDKKKRDLENYNRNPSNFFSVNMASKKSATMTGDVVRITSVVESTIDVKEFSKDRFFGCEFVKSVASFQCRLCDIKIHNASEVLPHIDSRVHRNKYQMHLKRVPDYEKKQKEQNEELGSILKEYEGQPVLLSESITTNDSKEDHLGKTLLDEMDSILVRVPEILNPAPKKEKEEKDKEAASEESNKQDEDEKKETDEIKEEERKEEAEMENAQEENNEEPMEFNEVEKSTKAVETTEESAKIDESTKSDEAQAEKEPESIVEEDAPIEEPDESIESAVSKEQEIEEVKDELKEENVNATPSETKPKRGVKKGSAVRGRGVARRGTPKRNRGGKSGSSPKIKIPDDEKPPIQKKGIPNDGSFMDGFQIVDEVQEE